MIDVFTRLSGVWIAALCLAIAPAAGCRQPASEEVARKFTEAQRKFDAAESSGDFLRVAGMYEEIREAGVVSGAVLYNQGNAYLRAGRRGEAIACYRQAQRFRPRDPDLAANLRNALGPQATTMPRGNGRRPLFWQDWFSPREKLAGCIGLGTAAFGVALWALLGGRGSGWWRVAAVLLVLTALAAGWLTWDWYRHELVTRGVVTGEATVARKGNGENYEPAFEQPLPAGTEFRLLERRDVWLRIRWSDGQQGWVRADEVVTY